MQVEKLFEDFKNIKYENITCITWYDSIKLMNINKKFSVYLKKINVNTMNFGSILLGFYSNEDNDIIIHIDDKQIKQKINAKILTYPLCNVILSKIGLYSNIIIRSTKEVYGIFITLTEQELNNMYNHTYFSNYFYENKPYHLFYNEGKIDVRDGLHVKKLDEIEIPQIINENIIWKNILDNKPNFNHILKYNNIIIKLSLDTHIWEKIKDNTEQSEKLDKIIKSYRKIFDHYNLHDSIVSDYL
jgi:hypothetical protein